MKMSDEAKFTFNEAFVQIWQRGKQPAYNRSSAEGACIHFYTNVLTDMEKQLSLDILEYLKSFIFATSSQLKEVFAKSEEMAFELDSLLLKMVQANYISDFILGTEMAKIDVGEGPFPEDALKIYCIDIAGNQMLTTVISNSHSTWVWKDVISRADIIIKHLTTTRYHTCLKHYKGDELIDFSPVVKLDISSREIRCSARFIIKASDERKEFLFESVRSSEVPAKWRNKVASHLKPLSSPNNKTGKFDFYRMAAFYSIPKLVILAEDEADLLEIADIYYKITENADFFLTTDKEIGSLSSPPAYWRFIPPTDEALSEGEFATGTLKRGAVPAFTKNTSEK